MSALGKDDYGPDALEGGHNSITAFLFAKTVLGKLKSDVYKPSMTCLSQLNAHHTYTVGAEVSMIAFFLREACQREWGYCHGELEPVRDSAYCVHAVSMSKDGSLKVTRSDQDPMAAISADALQSLNLNTAVIKAMKDLESYKASSAEDGAPRARIFAPEDSEFPFGVGGATTATSIKSSFDNTLADSPLFPFSATAQVRVSRGKSYVPISSQISLPVQSMFDFIEAMVIQRRTLEKIPVYVAPLEPAVNDKAKRSAGQKRVRQGNAAAGEEE